MEYEVLARRYRPRRFEEVVGQESVAATLRGGIVQGRVGHAYLFTGPRGVGKTSMARIFAKALNCVKGSGLSPADEDWSEQAAQLPCNACSTCDDIHLGQDIDVLEMDGASHRGIEDVRSIVESVNRPATRSPYKIFIIDEVHMLTREAFNALLKTLEEPPSHVKFIFATTEPHRIPDTVLSRCQRFDFHPINEPAIVLRLQQILATEQREAEDSLLAKIARYGRGGLRDAQTLLDQMLTFSADRLKADDLERITGRMPAEVVTSLCDDVIRGDDRSVLKTLQTCGEKGADPSVLLEQVIECIREHVHRLVSNTSERASEAASLDRLLGVLQILLEAARKLRHSTLPFVAVEVVLLKVARLEDPLVLEEVLRKLHALERGTASVGGATARRPSPPPPSPPPPSPPRGSPSSGPTASTRHGGEASREQPPTSPRVAPAPEAGERPQDRAGRSEPAPDVSTVSQGPGAPPREKGGGTPAEARGRDAPSLAPAAVSSAPEFSLQRLLDLWDQIGIELQEKQPHLAPLIGNEAPTLHPMKRNTLRLRFADDFYLSRMKSSQNHRALESLVAEVTGQPWKFDLVRKTDPEKEDAKKSPGNDPVRGSRKEGVGPTTDGGDLGGRPASTAPRPRARAPGAASGVAASEVVEKARKLFNGRMV